MNQEVVTIPKQALMDLLSFAMLMLVNEASCGRQRPSKDYSAVFGGEDEVFLYFHEELELQEMRQIVAKREAEKK